MPTTSIATHSYQELPKSHQPSGLRWFKNGAALWRTMGPRAISVGLGGWEYGPLPPPGGMKLDPYSLLIITPPQSGHPVCLLAPSPAPKTLILAWVFPFNAAPRLQFIETSHAKISIFAWVFPLNAASLQQPIETATKPRTSKL